jgi:predicted enzyme related to lactoylglutathione lyase
MDLLVNVDVDDLEKAIRFYGSAFELRIGRRFGTHAVEMLGASTPIYLLVKASGTAASATMSQTRNYRRHWTPVHLDFVIEQIEDAVQRALSAGATLERPVAVHKWGRIALMADPFGHGFCLIQFLGRGYDEIADRSRSDVRPRPALSSRARPK